jgi:hypothetical protein
MCCAKSGANRRSDGRVGGYRYVDGTAGETERKEFAAAIEGYAAT